MTTPAGVVLDSVSVNAAGRSLPEEPLPLPERDREDLQPELVHEAVLEQRRDQVAAPVHLQVRAVRLLELPELRRHVALEEHRRSPRQLGHGPGGHVFGRLVDGARERLGLLRPIGRKDVVGLPPQEQVEPRAHLRAHRRAECLVEVWERPAAVGEAAARILLGPPGVLVSGPSSVASVHRPVLLPHPPVSQARGDFTALPLIRRAFAVLERLGDPRDLPYFPCRAVHACRRPYAGGSAAPSRCAGTAMPGFLVLSASRHPRGPVSASNFRRGLRFRRCIVRVMLRPACLPGPPGWLGRDATICLAPRRLRTVSLPLLTASVAGRRWESG